MTLEVRHLQDNAGDVIFLAFRIKRAGIIEMNTRHDNERLYSMVGAQLLYQLQHTAACPRHILSLGDIQYFHEGRKAPV